MSETNFAPSETTRTDVQIGLVFEDQRTGDLRQVIYADSRVVLVRDETGHTTLTGRDSFESSLGTRFRVQFDADPGIDGGQFDHLRDRLAEYEARNGRTARHKAEALQETFDLFPGRTGDGDAADPTAGESDDDGDEDVPFEGIPGIGPATAGKLRSHGFVTVADVRAASDEALLGVAGVGPENLATIREHVD